MIVAYRIYLLQNWILNVLSDSFLVFEWFVSTADCLSALYRMYVHFLMTLHIENVSFNTEYTLCILIHCISYDWMARIYCGCVWHSDSKWVHFLMTLHIGSVSSMGYFMFILMHFLSLFQWFSHLLLLFPGSLKDVSILLDDLYLLNLFFKNYILGVPSDSFFVCFNDLHWSWPCVWRLIDGQCTSCWF